MQQEPRIGVGAVVLAQGKILLGLRKGAHGDGCWQLPGGHLDWFEKITDCARRELFEETGLTATKWRPGPWADAIFTDEGRHYVTVSVLIDAFTGTLEVKEPDKCECWQWFSYNALPTPLFLPLKQLVSKFTLSEFECLPTDVYQN